MEISLDSGERAATTAFDGRVLSFVSSRAFAPGSPISFRTELAGKTSAFEGRCIGSKRIDAARFEVRMRFVNLRRGDREAFILAHR